MRLPDFFVIGAPRSGTTALHWALRQHPEIYMPERKEPHFFATPPHATPENEPRVPRRMERYARISERSRYLELFSGATERQTVGEASCSYLRSPIAPRRIRESAPDARFVAVLRHPVARAHSSYWFFVGRGLERAPTLEQALAREERAPSWPAHFRPGLYHAQLSRYYATFRPEQIRVYLYEDWRERPYDMLRDLFGFLGVDPRVRPSLRECAPTYAPRSRRLHRFVQTIRVPGLDALERRCNLVAPPPMREDTRAQLHARYRDDMERLQTLIGRDLSHWLDTDRRAPAASCGVAA